MLFTSSVIGNMWLMIDNRKLVHGMMEQKKICLILLYCVSGFFKNGRPQSLWTETVLVHKCNPLPPKKSPHKVEYASVCCVWRMPWSLHMKDYLIWKEQVYCSCIVEQQSIIWLSKNIKLLTPIVLTFALNILDFLCSSINLRRSIAAASL